MNTATLTIKNKEWNSDLDGFICTTNDNRVFQVQFEREKNILDADYNRFFAILDTANEYGLKENFNEDELGFLRNLISKDIEIKEKSYELDEEFKKQS